MGGGSTQGTVGCGPRVSGELKMFLDTLHIIEALAFYGGTLSFLLELLDTLIPCLQEDRTDPSRPQYALIVREIKYYVLDTVLYMVYAIYYTLYSLYTIYSDLFIMDYILDVLYTMIYILYIYICI